MSTTCLESFKQPVPCAVSGLHTHLSVWELGNPDLDLEVNQQTLQKKLGLSPQQLQEIRKLFGSHLGDIQWVVNQLKIRLADGRLAPADCLQAAIDARIAQYTVRLMAAEQSSSPDVPHDMVCTALKTLCETGQADADLLDRQHAQRAPLFYKILKGLADQGLAHRSLTQPAVFRVASAGLQSAYLRRLSKLQMLGSKHAPTASS